MSQSIILFKLLKFYEGGFAELLVSGGSKISGIIFSVGSGKAYVDILTSERTRFIPLCHIIAVTLDDNGHLFLESMQHDDVGDESCEMQTRARSLILRETECEIITTIPHTTFYIKMITHVINELIFTDETIYLINHIVDLSFES